MSAIAVAVVGGALIGAVGSQHAASTQAGAAEDAAQLQYQAAQQERQDLQPFTSGGRNAYADLLKYMGVTGSGLDTTAPGAQPFSFKFDPTTDPSYQWRLNQGLGAIKNASTLSGGPNSGNAMRALIDYAGGSASQEYQDAWNRAYQQWQSGQNLYNNLYNLSSMGENAAAMTGNAAMQGANVAGDYLTQGANARAAGTIGVANALSGGLSDAALLYYMNQGNPGANPGYSYNPGSYIDPSMMPGGYTGASYLSGNSAGLG